MKIPRTKLASFAVGVIFLIALAVVASVYLTRDSFPLPSGETRRLSEIEVVDGDMSAGNEINESTSGDVSEAVLENGETSTKSKQLTQTSMREIFVTDNTKHSIPLDEILSGGPGKDGIPSIDDPKFINVAEANDFLNDVDPGIGVVVSGESRFYPYRILVWHEIVNDTIQGTPVLVTYCPLCATGIVFRREIDGEAEEFGVSGMLWQSNLLMYNRAQNADDEALWSQVLGESVVGVHTSKRLEIMPSDIVRWGDWKGLHPDTLALSEDTGAFRNYSQDPYSDYYTSESVSFGAQFRDERLHPKALVVGIEIDGAFKAYHVDALATGDTEDSFNGRTLRITKDGAERISIFADGETVPIVPGFWFSWVAVHPETELFQ